MLIRRIVVVAALVHVAGCTARPLDPTDTGASSGASEGPSGATQDPDTSTAPPVPTSDGPEVTSDPPSTTTPPVTSSTTTGGPMTTDPPDGGTTLPPDPVTSEPPFCGDFFCTDGESCDNCSEDCGGCALPEPLQQHCAFTWNGGTAVVGAGAIGAIDAQTAFFGWVGFGSEDWADLVLVMFDGAVDTGAATMQWYDPMYTPAVVMETQFAYDWVGSSGVVTTQMFVGDQFGTFEVVATVTGIAGSWDVVDPDDPPRVLGEIQRLNPNDPIGLEGKFDAAYCEHFNVFVIPE